MTTCLWIPGQLPGLFFCQYCENNNSASPGHASRFCVCMCRQGELANSDVGVRVRPRMWVMLKACIWGIAHTGPWGIALSVNHGTIPWLHPSYISHTAFIQRELEGHTGFKNFIIVTRECVCKTGLSRLLDAMKIWCGKYPVGAAFLMGTTQTQELSLERSLRPSALHHAQHPNDFAPPGRAWLASGSASGVSIIRRKVPFVS